MAPRNFKNRSPNRQYQSPLSHDFTQPVLFNQASRHESHGKRDSSVIESRYSYLRAVGNQVVAQENTRKSVDRIRMSTDHELDQRSKSDCEIEVTQSDQRNT